MSTKDIYLKPNIESFDLNTLRARRNMIISSLIIIFCFWVSDGINFEDFALSGFKAESTSEEKAIYILICTHSFLLFHFIWLAIDHYRTNKIRLSGPKPYPSKPPTMDSDMIPHAADTDPMQTSFYSWWSKQSGIMIRTSRILETLENKEPSNKKTIDSIKSDTSEILKRIEEYCDMVERFDKSFWIHQRSQLLRYWLFEFGAPLILGSVGLFMVIRAALYL